MVRAALACALAAVLALACIACGEATGTPSILLTVAAPAPTEEPAPTPTLDVITIIIGDAALDVEVAASPAVRQMGLSGREDLGEFDGMLFYFDSGRASSLWMKGMMFDLDFIWVGPDCTVVYMHRDVAAPEGPQEALPIYRPGAEAASVIEIAAGRAAELGIEAGDRVSYGSHGQGRSYGCDGEGMIETP